LRGRGGDLAHKRGGRRGDGQWRMRATDGASDGGRAWAGTSRTALVIRWSCPHVPRPKRGGGVLRQRPIGGAAVRPGAGPTRERRSNAQKACTGGRRGAGIGYQRSSAATAWRERRNAGIPAAAAAVKIGGARGAMKEKIGRPDEWGRARVERRLPRGP
jgi:hypothetical protein